MLTYLFAIPGIVILAWFVLGYWAANLLLYARRQPVSCTPARHNLPYEEVVFPSQDRLELKGWWIPAACTGLAAAQNPVVILLHPLLGNRCGFSAQEQPWPPLLDTTLDFMKIAALFHQAGYAVLTFDFRSHGESQRGLCAGGLMEDQDVMGAVDYAFQRLTTEASTATPIVGIVGFGLGAAAALAAVGREKGGTEVIHVFSGDSEGGSAFVAIEPPNVKRLRFLVAVEPASMGAWLRELLYPRIGVLYRLVVPLVEWLCQRRGGFPLGITRLLRFVQEVHIPVLVVKGCAGSCPKHAEAQQVYEAIPGEKQLWQIEGVKGAMQTYQCIEQHPERILAFASLHVDMRSSSL